MAKISQSVDLETRGRVAVLTVDNPPVNALSHHVRKGLHDGIKQATADGAVQAIVIVCAGRTFIAGADITEFGKPPVEPSLHSVLDLIEGSAKPVVAAIHGTALGGGLEVTLACHYRVGVKAARFGLPEVKLGILPGAGGTQRLPRVVGVEKGLQMMVSGDPIGAEEALSVGLIDEIAAGDLTAAGVSFAEKVLTEKRPLRKIRDLDDKLAAARAKPEVFANFRKSIAARRAGFARPRTSSRRSRRQSACRSIRGSSASASCSSSSSTRRSRRPSGTFSSPSERRPRSRTCPRIRRSRRSRRRR
jgi:3-hydroxyacyl-CoA dehydrogenase